MKIPQLALLATAAALALLPPSALAGVYKWVDKDGKVHFGDRLPTDQPTTGTEQIDRPSLPAALEQRLRSLDPSFVITRISGTLEVAYVCGDYRREAFENGETSRFPAAVERAKLGRVRSNRYGGYDTRTDNDRYDYQGRKTSNGRCPRPSDEQERDRVQQLFVIQFEPNVTSAYRGTAP